jgi:hypothetical protein
MLSAAFAAAITRPFAEEGERACAMGSALVGLLSLTLMLTFNSADLLPLRSHGTPSTAESLDVAARENQANTDGSGKRRLQEDSATS